ncbi:MAG: exodeoxyribonuclease VII large subunit [Solobacterium sp.]|nr:exodeoxyribonuclease VII large subunit [Solobacterium sp.]MDY2952926.1 exodeoxyribonuclease VII large subunit [Erysipelotrichaceae bacterium]MCI6695840.1 exodeoxyribonuclease VII large subunit [Solobacterium sp.]MCI6878903.1 exodeoxyribonuclease VII large subunit [Solobacterium sp.]MCI7157086.1 exodeoxyribonuclease VII large subunit [Solobacterium sp.]
MKPISVTTLVRYLKNKLDSDEALRSVQVSGELSNFRKTSSGHLYFTLKDENSAISCVMFKSKAYSLSFVPENGNKVICSGSISMFEASGSLQLYVNTLKLDGIGDLYRQYEELKNKLFNEGLFDDDHKKVLPTLYPSKVAVLCGKDSAAMSDIKIQFNRRWPLCKVDYYPVIVQGSEGPSSMIQTLKDVDTLDYEIIVLARGGGSFEDLFCFNDERLVRTIYNLNTFIITGVGHQQDFTLVDFVSDRRAPTPTGAIEMITPNIDDVLDSIDDLSYRLNKSIDLLITNNKDKLIQLSNNKYFKEPSLLVDKISLLLDYKIERLKRFSNKLDNYKLQIDKEVDRMGLLLDIKLNKKRNELDRLKGLLKAYSCENTLKRGYALVYKDNKLINKDIDNDDKLVIETYDQIIDTRVEKVSKKNG